MKEKYNKKKTERKNSIKSKHKKELNNYIKTEKHKVQNKK